MILPRRSLRSSDYCRCMRGVCCGRRSADSPSNRPVCERHEEVVKCVNHIEHDEADDEVLEVFVHAVSTRLMVRKGMYALMRQLHMQTTCSSVMLLPLCGRDSSRPLKTALLSFDRSLPLWIPSCRTRISRPVALSQSPSALPLVWTCLCIPGPHA